MSITLGGSWGSSSSACRQLTCRESAFQQKTIERAQACKLVQPSWTMLCSSSQRQAALAAGQWVVVVFLQAQLLPSSHLQTAHVLRWDQKGHRLIF